MTYGNEAWRRGVPDPRPSERELDRLFLAGKLRFDVEKRWPKWTGICPPIGAGQR